LGILALILRKPLPSLILIEKVAQWAMFYKLPEHWSTFQRSLHPKLCFAMR